MLHLLFECTHDPCQRKHQQGWEDFTGCSGFSKEVHLYIIKPESPGKVLVTECAHLPANGGRGGGAQHTGSSVACLASSFATVFCRRSQRIIYLQRTASKRRVCQQTSAQYGRSRRTLDSQGSWVPAQGPPPVCWENVCKSLTASCLFCDMTSITTQLPRVL